MIQTKPRLYLKEDRYSDGSEIRTIEIKYGCRKLNKLISEYLANSWKKYLNINVITVEMNSKNSKNNDSDLKQAQYAIDFNRPEAYTYVFINNNAVIGTGFEDQDLDNALQLINDAKTHREKSERISDVEVKVIKIPINKFKINTLIS